MSVLQDNWLMKEQSIEKKFCNKLSQCFNFVQIFTQTWTLWKKNNC